MTPPSPPAPVSPVATPPTVPAIQKTIPGPPRSVEVPKQIGGSLYPVRPYPHANNWGSELWLKRNYLKDPDKGGTRSVVRDSVHDALSKSENGLPNYFRAAGGLSAQAVANTRTPYTLSIRQPGKSTYAEMAPSSDYAPDYVEPQELSIGPPPSGVNNPLWGDDALALIHEQEHINQRKQHVYTSNMDAARSYYETPAVMSELTHLGQAAAKALAPQNPLLSNLPQDKLDQIKVPLTPEYQPSLDWLRREALRHGHIGGTKTMTELLNTPMGKQWLDMQHQQLVDNAYAESAARITEEIKAEKAKKLEPFSKGSSENPLLRDFPMSDKQAGLFYRDIEPEAVSIRITDEDQPKPSDSDYFVGAEKYREPRWLTSFWDNPKHDFNEPINAAIDRMEAPDAFQAHPYSPHVAFANSLLSGKPQRYRPPQEAALLQFLAGQMSEGDHNPVVVPPALHKQVTEQNIDPKFNKLLKTFPQPKAKKEKKPMNAKAAAEVHAFKRKTKPIHNPTDRMVVGEEELRSPDEGDLQNWRGIAQYMTAARPTQLAKTKIVTGGAPSSLFVNQIAEGQDNDTMWERLSGKRDELANVYAELTPASLEQFPASFHPTANSVVLQERSPGVLMHELGHAVDMNRRPGESNSWRAWRNTLKPELLQEFAAWRKGRQAYQEGFANSPESKDEKAREQYLQNMDSYHRRKYPAYGTYLGGTIGGLGGTLAGGGLGLLGALAIAQNTGVLPLGVPMLGGALGGLAGSAAGVYGGAAAGRGWADLRSEANRAKAIRDLERIKKDPAMLQRLLALREEQAVKEAPKAKKEKKPMKKQSIADIALLGGLPGALLGAAQAPKDHEAEGAARGNMRGLGTFVGGAAGALGGGILGAVAGHNMLRPELIGGQPHDGLALGALGGAALGALGGGVAGYRLANPGTPSWESGEMPEEYRNKLLSSAGFTAGGIGMIPGAVGGGLLARRLGWNPEVAGLGGALATGLPATVLGALLANKHIPKATSKKPEEKPKKRTAVYGEDYDDGKEKQASICSFLGALTAKKEAADGGGFLGGVARTVQPPPGSFEQRAHQKAHKAVMGGVPGAVLGPAQGILPTFRGAMGAAAGPGLVAQKLMSMGSKQPASPAAGNANR